MRIVTGILGLAALAGSVCAQETFNPQHIPLPIESIAVPNMPVIIRPSAGNGQPGYGDRDNCPIVYTHTSSSFDGGTYTAQGGFAQGEIAAASYTLPGNLFPLKITLMECLFAQQAAVVSTTTEWSVLVWEGNPQTGTLVAEFSSDGTILPHIQMGPGTRGTNVQASIDAADPDQIFIYNPNNLPNQTFTVGFRIDRHNNQTANPCFTAPPSTRNAFPVTDNTVIGCGSGYAALNHPTDNWLYAVNCGANGCPPNGGWTRFSNLQADSSLFGVCLTGCRLRGDWMIRVTTDPVNCPPPDGACCFGTFGCAILSQTNCQNAGGTWRGGGTTCGVQNAGQWSGCIAPPNQAPTADAGADQTVTDSDNSGGEVVVVDASASTDTDGIIQNYRWLEGTTVLQDGPAFLSVTLPVGVHTLRVIATDDDGATDDDTVQVTVLAGGPQCDWRVDGCYADFNNDGGIDGDDVIAFFGAWDSNGPCADVDGSSGVDGDDVIAFFGQWDSNGC
ncbi:MAG: hypothetical protein ACOYN0_01695 [Phycisphaerales bacterium]